MSSPAYIQANTDGRLHDATEPSVSPLNRGFLYGDAIYEVWRTYHRVLFAFHEHCARLERSAAALHLRIPLTPSALGEEIRRTVAAFRARCPEAGEVYVRLQITRGAGAIGLDIALAQEPSWVILVQSLRPSALPAGRTGLRLSVARGLCRNSPGALNPAWKTGNYLNNLLCLREARERGADEVVILNATGAVSEAAVSNVFFVSAAGELVTPPLAAGILAGVTRGLILQAIAPRAGVTAVEREVRPEEFTHFRECFLSSSTRDVTVVESIDECAFRTGPDTVANGLKQTFAEYAAEYARAHPEFRV